MSKPYEQPEQFGFRKKESEPFLKFVYNSSTGKILGRTGSSWAKICLFYTVFYGVLAALVAVCLWVFFQTLDPRTPRWQLEKSIIGVNPGLGFRPLPPEDQAESTLIWFRATNKNSGEKNYQYWIDALKIFLKEYETPGSAAGKGETIHASCGYDNPPPKDHVCNVEVKNWNPCTAENHYNYHKSSPCIFLKLNKIYGWIPEYYNDTKTLPSSMPLDLKTYISEINSTAQLNTVWVSCEGENPADIENIGPVKYIPTRGFPGYYYPYENSIGYLSPLIAIHLERPRTGVLINIECKAWARNIKHDRHDRLGSVHFELMID